MPEIEEELTFSIPAEKMVFHSITDDDTLVVGGINLNAAEAATLAWLINHPVGVLLEIQIKVKP